MLNFVWPWFFLLLPIPWFVRRWLPSSQQTTKGFGLQVPFFSRLSALEHHYTGPLIPNKSAKFTHKQVLLWLIWLFLLTALSRPEWLGPVTSIPQSGRDLMLAIDVSASMETPDLNLQGKQTDRLSVVKSVAGEFIQHRHGDRLGLILFGSNAYLQSPLTHDLTTTAHFLEEAVIGLAGERTAIGDAIGLTIKQFQNLSPNRRVLVLLTDGANNAGEVLPLKAAELAKEMGVQIYTIGVGAHQMEINSLLGPHTINPSRDLDEQTLRKIAELTAGQYFRATDTQGLASIYEAINKLEPVDSDPQRFRPVTAYYHWPLKVACLLSLLLVFCLHAPRRSEEESHV